MSSVDSIRSDPSAHELKRRTSQGAILSIAAQGAAFALRLGSMLLLARLLFPRDFGLVGMVTAFTGFLGLFRDAGLAAATVQRATITERQMSTLFWINVAVGMMLAALCVATAPFVVWFYGEPRLFWITVVIGIGFVFNGAAAQPRAILQRAMRFQALAVIDTVSLVASCAMGIAVAMAGGGYWAIVVMAVSLPIVSGAGAALASHWRPGPPERGTGVRSMLWYGGTVSLNGIVVYVAYNADKVLLGRFWGAEILGLYGRAYQLINIPTDNLQYAFGLFAFPALARVQGDSGDLRNYFLRIYALLLALCIPITAVCMVFAEDLVLVLLGPNWSEAASIFRLLAPTIFVFALINPLAWLMLAAGHVVRSLRVALMIAPVVIAGCALGVVGGPQGVAAGLSAAMLVLVVAVIM